MRICFMDRISVGDQLYFVWNWRRFASWIDWAESILKIQLHLIANWWKMSADHWYLSMCLISLFSGRLFLQFVPAGFSWKFKVFRDFVTLRLSLSIMLLNFDFFLILFISNWIQNCRVILWFLTLGILFHLIVTSHLRSQRLPSLFEWSSEIRVSSHLFLD